MIWTKLPTLDDYVNIEDLGAPMQWIKCSERLPKHGDKVLILSLNFDIFIVDYYDDVWGSGNFSDLARDYVWNLKEVSHWMPLPEAPEEEG